MLYDYIIILWNKKQNFKMLQLMHMIKYIESTDNVNFCPICKEDAISLTVTMMPCLHQICNTCANILVINESNNCPECTLEVTQFNNIGIVFIYVL